MGALSMLIFSFLYGAVLGGVSLALTKGKNLNPKWRALRAAVTVMFPVIGLVWSLFTPAKPPEGANHNVWNARNEVEALEKKIAEQELKINSLKEKHASSRRIQAAEFELKMMKANLADDYLKLGAAERKDERQLPPKESAIHVKLLDDGKIQFQMPYDMDRNRMVDVKKLIAAKYGISPSDPDYFTVSNKRQSDYDNFDYDRSVMFYNSSKNTIDWFGTDLTDEHLSKIAETQERFVQEVGKHVTDGLALTLSKMGSDSVALNYNGIVVAYAVSGKDGKVRFTGNNVPYNDMVSAVVADHAAAVLRKCPTMDSWLEAASGMVLSPENLTTAKKYLNNVEMKSQKKSEKRRMQKSLLESPAHSEGKVRQVRY